MASLPIFQVLSVLLIISTVRSASIASVNTADGFLLRNLEAKKTFTFAIAPKVLGQAMDLSFYDVDFPYTDCAEVEVDILSDGYVKRDYNKIAVICDADSLMKFTATSGRGFHVIVKMGEHVNEGTIKASFKASGGTFITSESLHG